MPPLDSTIPDTQDIQLITAWINSLPYTGRPYVPVFSAPGWVGTNLVLSGAYGWPGHAYYILTSTNLALPVANWAPLATNPFDPYGNFRFTNGVDPRKPGLFYLLLLP